MGRTPQRRVIRKLGAGKKWGTSISDRTFEMRGQKMYLGISDVKPLTDYRLELTFENDEKRIFDVKPYLHLGKLSELTDKNVFDSVRVSFDTIEWVNGADLDPELLYEESTPADTLHSA